MTSPRATATTAPAQAWTTRFTPEVTTAERAEALVLLKGLKRRPNDFKPPIPYVKRRLIVAMPKFPGLGVDMKDYIFARDLDDRVYDDDGFTMRAAMLTECPYKGKPVGFRQSEVKTDWKVHIDHIVAVADAWNAGGYLWDLQGSEWRRFCNDPTNLLAVSNSANAQKGKKTADKWLPTNPLHDWQARYVILQIQVKTRYHLSITRDEAAKMREILS